METESTFQNSCGAIRNNHSGMSVLDVSTGLRARLDYCDDLASTLRSLLEDLIVLGF